MKKCFLLVVAGGLIACNGTTAKTEPAPANDTASVSIEVNEQGGKVTVSSGNASAATPQAATQSSTQSASADLPDGANNWDDVLDDYEKYVEEFERVKGDMERGDVNTANENALMDRGEALQASIVRARSSHSLTPAQERRFVRLQGRMANMAVPTNLNMEDN